VTVLTPASALIWVVALVSVLFLAALGALAAWVGGAPIVRGAVRVGFWGIVAMTTTAVIGRLVGTAV
jgi:VIT1/CCC1 family predicted Fe2+/Mn2+ transporter